MTTDLLQKYPFLKKGNTVEEYVPPDYYNKLLKPYTFSGKTDLEIFSKYLGKQRDINNVLELCSGSGRVSLVATQALPDARFTLSDLSARMLDYTKMKFESKKNADYIESDAVHLLGTLSGQFDLTYTLWGFSHSVHQHIHENGFDKTKDLIRRNFKTFLAKNMRVGSRFYLVHFDSMSDEQKILMRQWNRVYPTFSDITKQSPSKRMLDEIFHELDDKNKIVLSEQHLIGDPILYEDEELLLEIFMNFHLETYFNQPKLLPIVVEDIKKHIAKYKNPDGSYSIKTGCYIYEIEKR